MTTNKKQYPFATKKSILATIALDDAFTCECLQIMLTRQTAHEVDTKSTKTRNRQGFMSSHAVKGTTLAQKSLAEGLTADEMGAARALVSRYSKQLASHFRQEAIANDPSLAEVARMFSADVPVPVQEEDLVLDLDGVDGVDDGGIEGAV